MGRNVFATAAVLLGLAGLILHVQLASTWKLPGGDVFIVVTSAAQVAGGIMIFFRDTRRLGAIILGLVYLLFSLTFVPSIVAQPRVYFTWGNLFYQLALVVGAAIVYGSASPSPARGRLLCRGAVVLFGVCNISYAIEQVEFFARTVSLVPHWIPPNGAFWAIVTTIAFGLAGIAMILGYQSMLASRLLALMLGFFCIAIWIPMLIVDSKTRSNWSEGLETFLIAGVAWVVADFLGRESHDKLTR